MRGVLNKSIIVFGLSVFFVAVAAMSQSRSGNAEQTGQNGSSLFKYNPQQPEDTPSESKPADHAGKVDHSPGTSFAPEDFLRHPGRIHYEQDEGKNSQGKKDVIENVSDKQQAHLTGNKEKKIKPSRKPKHEPHVGQPDRKTKTGTVSIANSGLSAERDNTRKSAVKPPHKPAKVGRSHPQRRQARPTQKRASTQKKGKQKQANFSAKTKSPKKPPDKTTAPLMPAVPPGKVKSDKLKDHALPTPSGRDEESLSNSKASRKNRLHDRTLKRLMLRPGTDELVASIGKSQDKPRTQLGTKPRDDNAPPDAKDNKYFVKTQQQSKSDYQIIYENGMRELNTDQRDSLRTHVLKAMQKRPGSKLIIKSYATPGDNGQSSDRRIALARALKLREFLIKQELDSNRINIRALGDATKSEPRDRIDFHISSP